MAFPDPQPPGRSPRTAGLYLPWGESRDLPVGFATTRPVELVRASIGGPVNWSLVAMVEGLAVGDTVLVAALPGLGQSGGVAPLPPLGTATRFVQFPSPGLPASELVVVFSVPVALVGAGRVTVVACPTAWPHWAHCDSNPGWRTR